MTPNEFTNLIAEISQARNMSQEDLLDVLANYLDNNYRTETDQSKREAIENIKQKVLTTLYGMADHSLVAKRPDIKAVFGLDNYEMTLVGIATSELEQNGLIEGGKFYTKLTPAGIIQAR